MKEQKVDHFAHAEATGRWWEHAWWDDANCETFLRIPIERVRAGAASIRRFFDDRWYLDLIKNPRKNVLMPNLCQPGTFIAEFIASFGERLAKLTDAPNVLRPIRAIREGDGYSAFLELETAEAFAEQGFEVSFPAEVANQRTPDVVASKDGMTIAIECKRLGDEEWEDWESELMRQISFSLPNKHKGEAIAVQVALNPRLSEIRFGSKDKTAEINAAVFEAIVRTVSEGIREALAHDRLPVRCVIQDIADVHVAKTEDERYGGVSGMERSVPSMFRRIFQNGVFRALDQLPKGSAGVIVVYSKHVPPAAFFRLFMDAATTADPERFRDLAGIMLCTLNTWFERVQPIYYPNAHTDHSDAAKVVGDVFTKTFGAVRA